MHQLSDVIIGWFLRVILMVICFHVGTDRASGDPKVVDEEVVEKWKAYQLFSRSLQGKARKTTTSDSGKVESLLVEFKQNQECVMSCFSREQEPTEICRFGNRRYAASIKRSKSDPSEVVLDKYTQSPQRAFPGISGDHASVFEITLPSISPHFRVLNFSLTQFISNPYFTILNATKESKGKNELTRIDYTFSRADSANGLQTKGRGWILLDPTQCWCVRRSKYSLSTMRKGTPVMDTEHDIEFETVVHSSGFPLVKIKTSHDNLYPYKTKKRLESTQRIEYEWEVNDSVSDSEFTLSAFGLPEPMGVEPLPPSRNWLWLLAAAIGAAILAILFAWLKRRNAGTAPRSFTTS